MVWGAGCTVRAVVDAFRVEGRLALAVHLNPALCALNPGPWTLDPGPWTLDPGPWTLDLGPWTLSISLPPSPTRVPRQGGHVALQGYLAHKKQRPPRTLQ